MKYKGMGYLRRKLDSRKERCETRYDYYEMKNQMVDISSVIPPEFRWLKECLGWCSKAVDSIADRISFVEFSNDNFNMQEIYDMNNPDVLFDSAIISSLITSCSFIYISQKVGEMPRLQVIDGRHATGIIDPITNMLVEGYAILEEDVLGNPIIEAYFIQGVTYFYERGEKPYKIKNKAPYPLLVPIINRPDAKRPFGHSVISRACISIQQAAMRTLKRSEVSAEFYSFPQKYVLGLEPGAEMDKWKATISSLMQISKDEDGDKPTVGQFAQQSMAPYVEQLKMLASLFAGETGTSARSVSGCQTSLQEWTDLRRNRRWNHDDDSVLRCRCDHLDRLQEPEQCPPIKSNGSDDSRLLDHGRYPRILSGSRRHGSDLDLSGHRADRQRVRQHRCLLHLYRVVCKS